MNAAQTAALLLAASSLLAACQPDRPQIELAGEVPHANGLVLALPAGYAAEVRGSGFSVRQTEILRSPQDFTLTLRRDERTLWQRFLAVFTPRESLTSGEPEGSSGALHTFAAWRDVGTCLLVVTASALGKNPPAFAAAKASLAASKVLPSAGC